MLLTCRLRDVLKPTSGRYIRLRGVRAGVNETYIMKPASCCITTKSLSSFWPIPHHSSATCSLSSPGGSLQHLLSDPVGLPPHDNGELAWELGARRLRLHQAHRGLEQRGRKKGHTQRGAEIVNRRWR